MTDFPDRVLVCVAWPYSAGDRHLGHVAGAYLPPDIFARYHRLLRHDVLMVSGSDTHGTPVMVKAEEQGLTPREVVDRYHSHFLANFRDLGLSFDLFTETDTENHWAVTQDMFLVLLRSGYIYRDSMRQLYCLDCQRWLPDRYVEGICPFCAFDGARGDQCDNCGRVLDATELGQPRCKICGGSHIEVRSTEHFFLDLAKLNPALLDWICQGKDHWRPNVLNFARRQIESGELRGRPITRDIPWGITIPVEGFDDKRIYVWFDAVIGYLSATKEWAQISGDAEAWRIWWQDPSVPSYYFIGKDNIPFHTWIWPGMLLGYGGLNLPYDIPANEYLVVEGKKLSASRHWVIELPDYLSRYDPDPLRYALTINAPETQDVNFTWEEFVRRNNDELVATWGNLANRVLGLVYKRYDGRVPQPGVLDEADQAMLATVRQGFDSVGELIGLCKFKAALTQAMALAREANRYLNDKQPWIQIKTDPQAAATTLYVALQAIDWLKIIFCPFLPFSSQKLHEYLGYDGSIIGHLYIGTIHEASRTHQVLRYDASDNVGSWCAKTLIAGQPLRQPQPLFRKLDESIVDEEIARMTGESAGGPE
jgi:methionyl-tRNA synthetase